jgi:hypothetical protein
MTATTDTEALPLRPAGGGGPGANAQYAPARPREGGERRHIRVPVPSGLAVGGLLAGASVFHAAPPSIVATWAHHKVCAAYYKREGWGWALARGLRLAYGGLHVLLLTALYLLAWAIDSPPKLITVTGLVTLALWLTHVI